MLEDVPPSTATGPPPQAVLLQMMTGYWVTQAIYVAAKLGIADRLTDRPAHFDELAAATKTHGPTLHRVLRALASVGIFTEAAPGQYTLTPLASLLRTGTPDSMRALALTYSEEQYRTWSGLLHCVQTGSPAFEHQFGMQIFDYFATHPASSAIFNEAMTNWTNQVAHAVLRVYDFSAFRTVVDVGGSHGTLLAAILQRNLDTRGILFDLPHVVAGADGLLTAAGVADRCTRIGGDFFQSVAAGGDACILAQIIHDWDDDHCLAILTQVRRVIPDTGKLLVVELVLPTGDEPSFGKWLDLHMLVMAGGRERTESEYRVLLRAAGFDLRRVVPTHAGPSVVEAIPV